MEIFNQDARTKNVVRTSLISVGCNFVNAISGFAYRTIFLQVLSATYLGINGLFTNVLQILSLADLGIATAIVYRFYEPISQKNVQKVGEYMRFFKRIYWMIAGVILAVGLLLLPFLKYLIKDASDIPADVNLHLVYVLYLLQNVSSYVCSYKHTLLTADQRQDIVTLLYTGVRMLSYLLQVSVLLLRRDFLMSLWVNIAVTILMNMAISAWVSKKYRPVFQVKTTLPKEEQLQIYSDTKATMMHKIGGTVLTGTDNIVLSKFVGLAITGLYSNYSLVIGTLNNFLLQLLGNLTASFGNAHVELSTDRQYINYKRMLFMNLWLAGMITTCLYLLVDDFVVLWLGDEMLLDKVTVGVICVQFYFSATRKVTTSYVDACGLFVKDRWRPLIESAINLIVSIILAVRIGIAGVFIGTIISHLCTVFWREPYILYRYAFQKKMTEYWKMFGQFSLLSFVVVGSMLFLKQEMFEPTVLGWIWQALVCFGVYNGLGVTLYHGCDEFVFFMDLLKRKVFKQMK